jgi:hypothetical protein
MLRSWQRQSMSRSQVARPPLLFPDDLWAHAGVEKAADKQ